VAQLLTDRTQSLRLFIMLLTIVSIGCVSRGRTNSSQPGPVKHFAMTFAFSEPLGESGSSLPEDAKAIFMPIESKNCSGFLFVPDVQLLRLDIQGGNSINLDLGQDRNAIQVGLGKPLTPQKARATREQALNGLTIVPLMAQPTGSVAASTENLKKLDNTSSNHYLLIMGSGQQTTDSSNNDRIIGVRDVNELTTKMALAFCNRAGQKPSDQPPSFTIVYKSGTGGYQPSLVDAASPKPITAEATPTGSPTNVKGSQVDADAALGQLIKEEQFALTDQTKKKSTQAKLAKAQAEYSWDFRFTYERAKLAVYGTASHDEAFYHLYRAAEIAIENGDQEKMLQALQNDSGEEGSFHKLSHGHQQWTTLFQALQTRNSGLVKNT
jgi:hypothetical protein